MTTLRCPRCKGTGYVIESWTHGKSVPCPDCSKSDPSAVTSEQVAQWLISAEHTRKINPFGDKVTP